MHYLAAPYKEPLTIITELQSTTMQFDGNNYCENITDRLGVCEGRAFRLNNSKLFTLLATAYAPQNTTAVILALTRIDSAVVKLR